MDLQLGNNVHRYIYTWNNGVYNADITKMIKAELEYFMGLYKYKHLYIAS